MSDLLRPSMLIAGELVVAADGATLESVNPATEEVIARIPDASPDDVDRAVQAARLAAPGWSSTPWRERAETLRRFADTIREHRDELSSLDVVDSGNPVSSMHADVESCAREIEYFAGLASELKGSTVPSGPGSVAMTEFVPYDVVARIVPFNHPVKFAAGKSAAPMAAGCPVIVKPGEQTSLSALRLGELARDVFPSGVFSVVTGTGSRTGAALSSHPDVPRVAFTGSVPTGRAIAAAGAAANKHVTLELGGKNPFVVFPDVDPAAAAVGAVAAANTSRSMGQSCGGASRILVHSSIRAEFTQRFVEAMSALRIGDPMEHTTQIGPLAFRSHYERVLSYIQIGRDEGARCVLGGGRPAGYERGLYVEPTVFTDVSPGMRIAQEEIFGPVVCIIEWSDEDEMIHIANGTEFGLTAFIWTDDISAALRSARRIEAGYININGTGARPLGTPFGGVKSSGIGKESSLDELLSYGRPVSINITLR